MKYLLELADGHEGVLDGHGNTLLHLACRSSDVETVKLLIDAGGATAFSRNHRGATPLHLALAARPAMRAQASAACADAVGADAAGADADAQGGKDEAVTTIVRLLSQAAEAEEGQGGASRLCALADNDGNTPLHNAVASVPKLTTSPRLVELLLSFDIPTCPVNAAAQTPLKMVNLNLNFAPLRSPPPPTLPPPPTPPPSGRNHGTHLLEARRRGRSPCPVDSRATQVGRISRYTSRSLITSFLLHWLRVPTTQYIAARPTCVD